MRKLYLLTQYDSCNEKERLVAVVPTLKLANLIANNNFKDSEWEIKIEEVDYYKNAEDASELISPTGPYILGFAIKDDSRFYVETIEPLNQRQKHNKVNEWKESGKNVKREGLTTYYLEDDGDQKLIYFVSVYDVYPGRPLTFDRFCQMVKEDLKDV